MAKPNKTQQTACGPEAYFSKIADSARRADCEALAAMMQKTTGEPAKMWGAGIVGFGSYHYKYESGREGDMCRLGFSSRSNAIAVYGTGVEENAALIAKLGKIKTGKGCLYIKKLADVDGKVLAMLLKTSVAAKRS